MDKYREELKKKFNEEKLKKNPNSKESFMDRLTRWPCLCCYDEVPEFQQENQWIHTGYRSGWTLGDQLLGLFYPFHNETVNIWTHLIGFIVCAVVFAGLAYEVRDPKFVEYIIEGGERLRHLLEPVYRWPVFIYLAGAMICLGGSAIGHSLNGLSQRSNYVLWRLDYIGIVVLIAASFFPPIYYSFMCNPIWKNIYLVAIVLFAMTIIGLTFKSNFHNEKMRLIRVTLFAGMGLTGIVPWIHGIIINFGVPLAMEAAIHMGLMAVSYLGGVVFYACRVPERWLPGKFDLLFNSHQIWHLAVLLGIFNHYNATMSLVEWRDDDRKCLVQFLK